MAVSGRGDRSIAAGPTELRRYLPISLLATGVVAGLPIWAAVAFGHRLGLVATLLSMVLCFALAHIGAIAWTRCPGSRDVVFNDLMLWGFVRRLVTQRRLIRRVERLGFSTSDDPDDLTLEERTKLLKSLAEGLEAGDPYTHGHSQRVARHAYMVAKTMKLPRRDAEKIRLAGVIHDVGKLRIPREIITKPGKLTDAEFDVIKRHTVDGGAMVDVLRDPEITDMVRHHHERLDGSGYPDKLTGDDISIGARVLAVADTFDAVSSVRPYRAAQKHKLALDILEQDAAAGRLDPAVVDAFIRYYTGRRAVRWWAFLSAGPARVYDLPGAFVQRLGTTGVAKAAVVGVTAVALAPGSPFHGRPDDGAAIRNDGVARAIGHNPGAESPSSAASGSGHTSGNQLERNKNDASRRHRSSRENRRGNASRRDERATDGHGSATDRRVSKALRKDRDNEAARKTKPSGGIVAGAVEPSTDALVGTLTGGATNSDSETTSAAAPGTTSETKGNEIDSAPTGAVP